MSKLPGRLAYLLLPMLLGPNAWARGQAAQPIEISFAAEVAGAPFDCSKTYANVGENKADWQPQDFRFYVSDVRLLRADHTEVPVALISDGTWQNKDVALLDFENKTGTCQNGTPQTNTKVRGTVPDLSGAVGLKFTVAVPFALNHADASTQDAPLDQAGLFWGWQLGYKFLSLEGRVPGKGAHVVHLGSTGCTMPQPGKVTGCAAMNEAQITLPRFDVTRQVVVADVARLLQGSVVGPAAAASPAGTGASAGCMAEHDNANCGPVFAKLGLPFGNQASGPQQFFSAR